MTNQFTRVVLAGLLGCVLTLPVEAQSTSPTRSLAEAIIDAGAAFGPRPYGDSLVIVNDSSFLASLPQSDVVAALQRPGSNLRIEGNNPAIVCGEARYSCSMPNGGAAIRLYELQVLGDSAVAKVTVSYKIRVSNTQSDVASELVQFTLRLVSGDWQLVETKRLQIS
jgi:hypothetical protein